MLSLNGKLFEPRRRANGSMASGGKVALHLAVIEFNEATANPARPCTPEKVRRQASLARFIVSHNASRWPSWEWTDLRSTLSMPRDRLSRISTNSPVCIEQSVTSHRYLCSYSQAVTQRAGIDINSEALFKAGITTWVTKTDSNRARRSNYGRRDYQVITLAPDSAKAFNLAVDQEAVKKIVGEIAEMKKAQRDREAPNLDLRGRHDAARKKAQDKKDQAVHPLLSSSYADRMI